MESQAQTQGLGSEKGPQVSTEISRMDNVMAEVEKAVTVLEDRLITVIREEPPIDKDNVLEESLVPLAKDIAHETGRLIRIRNRLQSLTARLEV